MKAGDLVQMTGYNYQNPISHRGIIIESGEFDYNGAPVQKVYWFNDKRTSLVGAPHLEVVSASR